MLNKALCKKCYNAHRFRPWDEHRKRNRDTQEMFVQKDWTWDERGIMFCVALMDTSGYPKRCQIRVNEPPPSCCYYLVAQLMTAAEKKEKHE